MNKKTKGGIIAAVLIAAVAVISVVIGETFKSDLPRTIEKNVHGTQVAVEEHTFFRDENRIFGKFYSPVNCQETRPVLIFCHGLGRNGDSGEDWCKAAVDHGFYAYQFDFRGGSPDSRSAFLSDMFGMTVSREIEDLETVIKRLSKDKRTGDIYLLGHGLGGLVASEVAIKKSNKVKGLLLIAPAFSYPGKFRDMYKNLRSYPDTMYIGRLGISKEFFKDISKLRPYKHLDRFDGNVLLIHSKEDTEVEYSSSEIAVENFRNCEFTTLSGNHDFSGKYRKEVVIHVMNFLDLQLQSSETE